MRVEKQNLGHRIPESYRFIPATEPHDVLSVDRTGASSARLTSIDWHEPSIDKTGEHALGGDKRVLDRQVLVGRRSKYGRSPLPNFIERECPVD